MARWFAEPDTSARAWVLSGVSTTIAHAFTLRTARRIAKEHNAIEDIRALVTQARKISPSATMTLYVTDVERALGLTDQASPHKLGMNE